MESSEFSFLGKPTSTRVITVARGAEWQGARGHPEQLTSVGGAYAPLRSEGTEIRLVRCRRNDASLS